MIRSQPRVVLSPAVARRVLCFDLGRLIRVAGVTHQTVGEWLGVSRPAVTAAIQGKALLSRPAVEVICTRLDRDEWLPRLDGLLAAARRKPGATKPRTGPHGADLLHGLEAFADTVTIFDPWLVPALLHTRRYAAALATLDDSAHHTTWEHRQAALLTDADPLIMQWITSEHVLHRHVGGQTVMDDQRAFLAELSTRPNVTIRVIPADRDLPPGLPFQVLRGTSTVVAECTRLAVHYTHEPDTVEHFERLARSLDRRALPPEESRRLIQQARG